MIIYQQYKRSSIKSKYTLIKVLKIHKTVFTASEARYALMRSSTSKPQKQRKHVETANRLNACAQWPTFHRWTGRNEPIITILCIKGKRGCFPRCLTSRQAVTTGSITRKPSKIWLRLLHSVMPARRQVCLSEWQQSVGVETGSVEPIARKSTEATQHFYLSGPNQTEMTINRITWHNRVCWRADSFYRYSGVFVKVRNTYDGWRRCSFAVKTKENAGESLIKFKSHAIGLICEKYFRRTR